MISLKNEKNTQFSKEKCEIDKKIMKNQKSKKKNINFGTINMFLTKYKNENDRIGNIYRFKMWLDRFFNWKYIKIKGSSDHTRLLSTCARLSFWRLADQLGSSQYKNNQCLLIYQLR